MSILDFDLPEHKLQNRVDDLSKELSRVRATTKKQSLLVSNLRLWLYLTLAFFITLLTFLAMQGFISNPKHVASENILTVVDTVYIEKSINKDSLRAIQYNTHKGAIRKTDYDGILFAIQIGAYKDLDLHQYEDNMLGLKQDTYDSINQFTLGEFIDYEEALNFLDIVQRMGFKNAHMMSFKNGYRLRLENALAQRQQIIATNKEADRGFIEANDERFELLAK